MKYSKDYIKHFAGWTEIGRKRFNKEIPPRCTQHDVVKNAYSKHEDCVRCIVCKYYHLDLNDERCFDCLMTDDLDNFYPDEILYENKAFSLYFYTWKKRQKMIDSQD